MRRRTTAMVATAAAAVATLAALVAGPAWASTSNGTDPEPGNPARHEQMTHGDEMDRTHEQMRGDCPMHG